MERLEADRSTNWFQHEIRFFRAFKNAGFEALTCFDIGSSHSGWAYQMGEIFPTAKLHLFEPLLDYRDPYKKSTTHVLELRPDFRVHKVAVGDKDGIARMGLDETGYGASTLVTERSATFTDLIDVPIRRLDTVVFELGLPKPEVLKIDVQGGELAVLTGSGSLLDSVQLIQAEVWFMRRYGSGTPLFHEVNDYLASKGFLLVAFGDFYYGDLHELYAGDAFFAKEELLRRCKAKVPNLSLTADLEGLT
jgi:FkbM family methyltransferase